MTATELVKLLDVLDPHKEPGRVTLITRYGADKVRRPCDAVAQSCGCHDLGG